MADRRERTFRKGEIIYHENDYEACMYDILYGSVALYQHDGTKDEVLVKRLNAESYFGELELIEARARTTTAVALEKDARQRAVVATAGRRSATESASSGSPRAQAEPSGSASAPRWRMAPTGSPGAGQSKARSAPMRFVDAPLGTAQSGAPQGSRCHGSRVSARP